MKIPQIESTLHHIWILTPRSIFSSNSSKSLLDRWGDGDCRHHPWKGAPAISGDRLTGREAKQRRGLAPRKRAGDRRRRSA